VSHQERGVEQHPLVFHAIQELSHRAPWIAWFLVTQHLAKVVDQGNRLLGHRGRRETTLVGDDGGDARLLGELFNGS
jgi:hypothetical protein